MRSEKMIDRAARDEERQQVLGKDKWCSRFADRIQYFTDVDRSIAEQCAEAHWPEYGKGRPDSVAGGEVINLLRIWNK